MRCQTYGRKRNPNYFERCWGHGWGWAIPILRNLCWRSDMHGAAFLSSSRGGRSTGRNSYGVGRDGGGIFQVFSVCEILRIRRCRQS
jgi:hypothetical protein